MESLDNQIIVSIQCLVYNHAPYIRQCLDGFVMQKTNFRFEAIIHDDASTDGTQDIIREYEQKYPDIIKPIYQKENQYSKGIPGYITNLVTQKCKGKYIAICEGDDYWIDPLKLQKQVDFLENHPDYSLVHTGFKNINEQGEEYSDSYYERYMSKSFSGCILSQLFRGNYILTLTVCFRKSVYESELYINSPKIDYSLFLAAAMHGDVCYFNDITGCYRHTLQGVSHSNRTNMLNTIDKTFDYYLRVLFKSPTLYLTPNKAKVIKRSIINHFTLSNKSKRLNGLQYSSLSDFCYFFYCIILRRINLIKAVLYSLIH